MEPMLNCQVGQTTWMVRWCDYNAMDLNQSGMSIPQIAQRFLGTITEETPMLRRETVEAYLEAIAQNKLPKEDI